MPLRQALRPSAAPARLTHNPLQPVNSFWYWRKAKEALEGADARLKFVPFHVYSGDENSKNDDMVRPYHTVALATAFPVCRPLCHVLLRRCCLHFRAELAITLEALPRPRHLAALVTTPDVLPRRHRPADPVGLRQPRRRTAASPQEYRALLGRLGR